jgi:hypothetical protein
MRRFRQNGVMPAHPLGRWGRARIVVFTVVAALALAACGDDDEGGDEPAGGATTTGPAAQSEGGGPSDETAIRTTMVTYIKALAAGDGATACAQLTENGKRIAASVPGAKADDCEAVIDEIGGALKASDREKLGEVQPEDVEVRVSGDTSTATFRGAQTAKLVRRGERWLIDSYGTRPGQPAEPEDDPGEDVKSVPFDRVEEKLREALDKRYDMFRYECPTAGEMRVNQKVECRVTADGERGTAQLELVPGAYLRIRLDVGGRLGFSQSQVTP